MCLLLSLLAGLALAGPNAPVVTSSPEVHWPDDLRANGVGGEVVLVLQVDGAGWVRSVRVVSSPHPRLARAAVSSARRMRFEGTGEPVTAWRTVVFEEQAADVVVLARSPWREGSTPLSTGADPAGSYSIARTDLQDQPGAGGDVARAIATLPAVSSTSLRNPAVAIRAGAPDETLWVVDDVALPSRRSAGGVLSRVNPALVDRVSVHAGTQPATVGESVAGVVQVELIDPDDAEIDGQVELSPLLAQAWVSAPVGARGAGNAVMVAVRRSLLEPWVSALRAVDIEPGVDVVVGDVAVRATLQPGAAHTLKLTASHSDERVDSDILGGIARNRSATSMAQLRHRWQFGRRTVLQQDFGFVRETQDIWVAEDDHRQDLRVRPSWRLAMAYSPRVGHTLHAGSEIAHSRLQGEGVARDPRARPVFDRVPWYALDPPVIDLRPDVSWTEGASWLQWRMSPKAGVPLHAHTGVRITWSGPLGRPVVSPRASLSWEARPGSLVRTWGAVTHQLPRDPVHLDDTIGPRSPTPARAVQVGVGVQQAVGQVGALRVDVWRRDQTGVVVWPDDVQALRTGGRSSTTGTGSAQGVEASFAVVHGPMRGLLSYAGVHATRTNPLATLGPQTARPWWVVPHTLRLTADASLGARGSWKLGTHLQVRSGARQATVTTVGTADDYVVEIAPNGGDPMPTRLQWSVRGQRRVVVRKVQLTVYLDLMQIVGGRTPIGVGLRASPDGPPDVVPTRDLPFLPWLGARAEF